jgi:hypothetical protein
LLLGSFCSSVKGMNIFAQVEGVALAPARGGSLAKFKLVTSVSAGFLTDRNLAN